MSDRWVSTMSPPTNGATSLAFFPPAAAAGLPDALLFPFDGFCPDDFFTTAPAPPPPGADPNRLLLLPASGNGNGGSVLPQALAVAAPTTSSGVTATSGSPSSAPPSPSLPLMPNVGHRTSCYRGVTRYACARLPAACLASDKCG